jgi:hypothetical protein
LLKIHVALPRQALSAAMGSYGRERESKRPDPNSTNRVGLFADAKTPATPRSWHSVDCNDQRRIPIGFTRQRVTIGEE